MDFVFVQNLIRRVTSINQTTKLPPIVNDKNLSSNRTLK